MQKTNAVTNLGGTGGQLHASAPDLTDIPDLYLPTALPRGTKLPVLALDKSHPTSRWHYNVFAFHIEGVVKLRVKHIPQVRNK